MSKKITVVFAIKTNKLQRLAEELSRRSKKTGLIFDSFVDPRNLCGETADGEVVVFQSTHIGVSRTHIIMNLINSLEYIDITDYMYLIKQESNIGIHGQLDYPDFDAMTLLSIAQRDIKDSNYVDDTVSFPGYDDKGSLDVRLNVEDRVTFSIGGKNVELSPARTGQLIVHLHNLMNYTDRGGDQ